MKKMNKCNLFLHPSDLFWLNRLDKGETYFYDKKKKYNFWKGLFFAFYISKFIFCICVRLQTVMKRTLKIIDLNLF